jgi:hypothetical protein
MRCHNHYLYDRVRPAGWAQQSRWQPRQTRISSAGGAIHGEVADLIPELGSASG